VVTNYATCDVVSGFHSKVDENCALLASYAASSGNSLSTFRVFKGQESGFFTLEDGTDWLSRSVSKELPLLVAKLGRTGQFSSMCDVILHGTRVLYTV